MISQFLSFNQLEIVFLFFRTVFYFIILRSREYFSKLLKYLFIDSIIFNRFVLCLYAIVTFHVSCLPTQFSYVHLHLVITNYSIHKLAKMHLFIFLPQPLYIFTEIFLVEFFSSVHLSIFQYRIASFSLMTFFTLINYTSLFCFLCFHHNFYVLSCYKSIQPPPFILFFQLNPIFYACSPLLEKKTKHKFTFFLTLL